MKKPMLDLHGFKEDEVFDALESFFAKNGGKNPLYIMPGKGKGIVKAKVIEYLKLAGYPWSPLKEGGKTNEGILVVHME